jgi:hypothetical protein
MHGAGRYSGEGLQRYQQSRRICYPETDETGGVRHVTRLGATLLYNFALSRHRRAKVWLDEAPPAEFIASFTMTRIVRPEQTVVPLRTIAAIEMMIPHGPFASYALLGGELVPSEADGLEVMLPMSATGRPFAPSLALQTDDVRTGIPEEYADAVFAGIERASGSIGIPVKSSLRFRWAAHGLVGSSSSMFNRAAGLVVQLLTLPEDASEECVVALLK